MHAEHGNDQDTKAVAEDSEHDNKSGQEDLLPGCTQKHVPGQQGGDEQDQAGMDPAAFRADGDEHPWELEDHPVPEHGSAG